MGLLTRARHRIVHLTLALLTGISVLIAPYSIAPAAAATVWTVDDGIACDDGTGTPFCTVTGAVASGLVLGGDTIEIRPGDDGIYHGDVFVNKALTINGMGATASDVTLMGGGGNGTTLWNNGHVTTVSNLTISGGTNSGVYNAGGATVTLTLIDVVVSGNTAPTHGGGIYNNGGAYLVLNHSRVTGNSAPNDGGGIYNTDGAKLEILNGSQIDNNTAASGGGVYHRTNADLLTIADSTIGPGNGAVFGGGVAVLGPLSGIRRSTIAGNTAADDGGGVYFGSGSLSIEDSTISGNVAVSFGGGVFSSAPSVVTLSYATITENESQSNGAGGIDVLGGPTGGLDATGSIIAGNTGGPDADCRTSGISTSGGGNVLGEGPQCPGINAGNGDVVIGAASPGLAPLADYGGFQYPTQTHALLPSSPALDAGSTACSGGSDQRRFLRLFGSACDAGAFEASGQDLVNVTASGGTLNLGAGEWGTLIIDQPIAIVGQGPASTQFTLSASPTVTVNAGPTLLDGVLIQGGTTAGVLMTAGPLTIANSEVSNNVGSGINNTSSSLLTVDNSDIVDNVGTVGGGIASTGDVDIDNGSAISGNSATDGGGIAMLGGTLTATGSTITGNDAANDGGGIHVASGATARLSGSSLSANTAGNYGGGLRVVSGGALKIIDGSVVTGNSATIWGSGVFGEFDLANSLLIEASTFDDNDLVDKGGGLVAWVDCGAGCTGGEIIDSTFQNHDTQNGGAAMWVDAGTGSRLDIVGTTFTSNRAECPGFGGGCGEGGAVLDDNGAGTIFISDSTFTQNVADYAGGAINTWGGLVQVVNSTFTNNRMESAWSGSFGGGAIANQGDTLAVGNSTFDGNISTSDGAGIHVDFGSATIADSTFSNNVAFDDGGAVMVSGGTTVIDRARIFGNASGSTAALSPSGQTGNGGGIAHQDGFLTVRQTAIFDNTARGGSGGGVGSSGGTAAFENVTISGNEAIAGTGGPGNGGGIANEAGLFVLNSSTVTANSAAGSGGGVHNADELAFFVGNSILADNTAPDGDCGTIDLISFGHNLLQSDDAIATSCGVTDGVNGDIVGTTTAPANLGLQTLALNAPGTTETHALAATSEARNAGDPGDLENFPTFAAPLPLPMTFNGTAAIVDDGGQDVFRTNPPSFTAGSGFLSSPLPVNESWQTRFDFRIEPIDPLFGQDSADGMTFAIAPAATFLGEPGGRLGIGVIGSTPSVVAVEFDTWPGSGDPGDNHIGIDVNPATPVDTVISAATAPAGVTLDDGVVRTAWIDYNATTQVLEVRLAPQGAPKPASALVTHTVDIAAVLGVTDAHFGFTGASGSATAEHDVLNWTLTTGIGCAGIDQRGVDRFATPPCDIGAYEGEAIPLDLTSFSYTVTPDPTTVGVSTIPIIDIPIETVVGGTGADYEASPLGSIPLGSIPLGSIDLLASPLGSIPLGSIPLGSIDIQANPLGSIPLGSIPLGSIGGWEAILAGTALEGIPLQNVTLDQVLELVPEPAGLADVTLADIGLQASPLGSISLPSISLGDTDLLAIDPTLCDGLAGFDCTQPDQNSLIELEIAAAPLGSIPLGSIPLGSIPLGSIPLGSIPLGSIPLGSIPLGSIPLGSIPLGSIDLLTAPLGSIPLGSIPLGSIPLGSIPLGSIDLAGTPLGSIPLGSIGGGCGSLVAPLDCATLGVTGTDSLLALVLALEGVGESIASTPLGSIPLGSIPLGSIPLGSIDMQAVPLGSIPLGSIDMQTSPLGSIPLGSIGDSGACAELVAPLDCATLGITDASLYWQLIQALEGATATIGDTPLGSIPLGSIRLGSIPLGSIDLDVVRINGAPLGSIPLGSIGLGETGIAGSPLGSIPLGSIPLGSIGNVVDCNLVDCNEDTLGDAEIAGAILATATLGDLDVYGTMTLGELDDLLTMELLYGITNLGDAANDYGDLTFGQILISLLLQSDYPWETLPLMEMGLQQIALDNGTANTVTYAASFEIVGGTLGLPATLTANLPEGFFYAEDTATMDVAGLGVVAIPDPVITELGTGEVQLVFDLTIDGAGVVTVTWDAVPGFITGDFSTAASIDATALIPAPTGPTSDTAPITVTEFFTGNTDLSTAIDIDADTLVFSHIATSGVSDFFSFAPGPVGTKHAVFLSQFDADTDLVLYRPATAAISAVPPRAVPLGSIPIEDDGVGYGGNATEEPEVEGDIDIAAAPLGSISLNRGTTPESADSTLLSTPLDATEPYTIQVSGYQGNASSSPYVVRVKRDQIVGTPACTPASYPGGHTGGPSLPAYPAGMNTLVLMNWQRTVDAFGLTAANDILADANAMLASGANGVVGAVLPVGLLPGVAAAYATWDANPCDTTNANAVVSAITSEVANVQAAHPTLAYVTIIGGDDLVPFARMSDLTSIANESTYTEGFDDGALFGALVTRHYLSDDPYADLDPIPWLDRFLHVPDLAVGRLVEQPAEIRQALQNFVTFNGQLDPQTASVAGYDFLDDGSEVIFERLENIYGAAAVDKLIDLTGEIVANTWTEADLLVLLDLVDATPGSDTADIISVNAHSDHFRQLPSFGDAAEDENDLFEVGDLGPLAGQALAGNIVFTMGCHAGLSVSDIGIGATNTTDWAQTYAAQGALYVANSGYGYGDTAGVALSERLMAEFAENLDGTMTVGQALTFAKQEYFAQLGQYPVYDEKALQQAIFYGLPMYSLAATPPTAPSEPLPTAVDPGTGLEAASLSLTPTYDAPNVTPEGTYYSIDGKTQQTHYRPTQPLDAFDVTQDDALAHGAVVTGATTTDIGGFDPVYFRPRITGALDTEPEVPGDEIATPVFGLNIATYNRPGTGPNGQPFEQAQQGTIIAGSFLSPADGDQTGTQRLTNAADLKVFYAPLGSTDFTAPRILAVNSVLVGNQVSFQVETTDDVAIAQVLALYRNTFAAGVSTWVSVPLPLDAGNVYSGGGPVDPSGVVNGFVDYKIWVIDTSGNVSTTDFKNVLWEAAAPPPIESGVELGLSLPPAQSPPWYSGPVTVTVTGTAGVSYAFSAPGVSGTGVGPSFTFAVPNDGVNLVTVTGGGETATATVLIDATPPQTPLISVPTAGQVLTVGDAATFDFSCPDSGSGADCAGAVAATSVADGDPIDTSAPGTFTLEVTATDIFGRTASTSVDYHVVTPFVVTGPGEPLPTGVTASASSTITDVPGVTATWDWGDGTTTPATIMPTTAPSADVSGDHVYTVPGLYRISLTVDYGNGFVVTVFEDIVTTIFDPAGKKIMGSGKIFDEDLELAFKVKRKKNGTLRGDFEFEIETEDEFGEEEELEMESDGITTFWIFTDWAEATGTGEFEDGPAVEWKLTVVDGDLSNPVGPDTVEILVWKAGFPALVLYDLPATPLDKGKVKIKRK